jgi:hypothetical protein
MGYDILMSILNSIKVTQIVQMITPDSSKNMPINFAESVSGCFNLHSIQAFITQKSKLNASENRTMSLTSYFMKSNDDYEFMNLAKKIPFIIPYDSFYLKFMFEEVYI